MWPYRETDFLFINEDTNVPVARAHLFICCVCAERKCPLLRERAGWGCHFEECFSVKCQLLSPEVKLNVCIFSSHSRGHTKQRAASPPTNSLTLIGFASPWKCPQISDLSKLFCLYNPLCTTWPCSIPTASSSPLGENNADSNNVFSLH